MMCVVGTRRKIFFVVGCVVVCVTNLYNNIFVKQAVTMIGFPVLTFAILGQLPFYVQSDDFCATFDEKVHVLYTKHESVIDFVE